jgi:hypothetical protein
MGSDSEAISLCTCGLKATVSPLEILLLNAMFQHLRKQQEYTRDQHAEGRFSVLKIIRQKGRNPTLGA